MTDTVATRYAGTRVPRVEDTRLLTGRGTFVDDVTRPGMLHACFVRSPFARAKINGIDAAAALALPGVHAVFTAGDLNPRRQGGVARRRGQGHPGHTRPPLAEGEVKFVGDPVALVVAESRYIAEDAVELVDVDYEPLPAVADFTKAAERRRSSSTRPTPTTSQAEWAARRRTRRRSRRRARRAEANIYQQIVRAGADGDPRHGRRVGGATEELTVWASTQTPHELRAFAARLLGIPAQASGSSCATPAAGSARRSSRCARTCASCWPRARCPPH